MADAHAGNIGDESCGLSPWHHRLSHPRHYGQRHLAIATLRVHVAAMHGEVTYPGRPDRGAGQFSLPLRAAAGAALSGVSGRHLAGALLPTRSPSRASSARRWRRRLLFVLGFSTVFVALGASASVGRLADPRLFRPAGDDRRRGHHRHGPALPRRHADRAAAPAEAAGGRQAGRPVGRLCDRAGFRFRLDALHRADPGGDPGGGGVRADGGQGRQPAWRSIRWASAFPSSSRPSRSSRSPRFSRASRSICIASSRRWARCLVLTGIAFLTGSINQMSVWLLEAFPALGKIG